MSQERFDPITSQGRKNTERKWEFSETVIGISKEDCRKGMTGFLHRLLGRCWEKAGRVRRDNRIELEIPSKTSWRSGKKDCKLWSRFGR